MTDQTTPDFKAMDIKQLLPIAEKTNDPKAQFALGQRYHDINCYEIAAEWYSKAAEQGHAGAQNNLGVLYNWGSGVPENRAIAKALFLESALQGSEIAEVNLALSFKEAGEYTMMAVLLKRAAGKGDAEAQCHLASAYENGLGVPRDRGKMIFWLYKAAEQGFTDAEYSLGKAYHRGIEGFIEPNLERAKEWYGKAAEKGDQPALKVLKEMDEAAAQGSKSALLAQVLDKGAPRQDGPAPAPDS